MSEKTTIVPGEVSNAGVTGSSSRRTSARYFVELATLFLGLAALVGIGPFSLALQSLGFAAPFIRFLHALAGFELCLIRLLRPDARLPPLIGRLLPALFLAGTLASQ